jgi:hypothetical protein
MNVFQNSKTNAVRALVAMKFTDGKTETVSMRLSLSSKLSDTLNGPDTFFDVVNSAGKQYFVARSAIVNVELIEVPKASQLNMHRRASDREQFNPHQILGIAADADADRIREAYHAMVKAYHPDRFSGFDLPKEMKDYAAAMLVRINLAYEQIGA